MSDLYVNGAADLRADDRAAGVRLRLEGLCGGESHGGDVLYEVL